MIIGSRERAKDVINAIGFQLGAGFRVLGCLEIDPSQIGTSVKNGIRVIETVDSLKKVLFEQVVDEIIFAMPLKKIASADQYISLAEEMGVSVRIIPDWQIHYLMCQPAKAIINFEDFLGIPSMALRTTPPAPRSDSAQGRVRHRRGRYCLPPFSPHDFSYRMRDQNPFPGPCFFQAGALLP